MRAITKHVERSSQEQNRGGKQITKSIESISEMVAQLNSAQREQARGGDQILAAVEQLRDLTRTQEMRFGDLLRRVEGIRRPPTRA
jgi:methyl-accepting chemotaxis protein